MTSNRLGMIAAITIACVLHGATVHAQACAPGTSAFTDVPDSASYCSSTLWLKSRAVTVGCTGTAYCPETVVSRASMALFMNRLGAVLTPTIVRRQGSVAAYAPGTAMGNHVCTTDPVAVASYPRVAAVSGVITGGEPNAAMTLLAAPVVSIDGGAFGVPPRYARASMQSGGVASLPISGVFTIDAGKSPTFAVALYQSGAAAGATLGAMDCDVVVRIDQQNTAAAAAAGSVPANPIAFQKNNPVTLNSGTTNYAWIPTAYDATHNTPMGLLVWLHGCGGESSGEIWVVSTNTQGFISMTVGGAEGGCWDVNNDGAKVLAAIADIRRHFNIKPKGIVIGGYSSGGDLSYRTAFQNANAFAGLLALNTDPFSDTGLSQAQALAAASWKFNVAHVAHLQDDTYLIGTVRAHTDAMKAAGFPLTLIERTGEHYNDAGDIVDGLSVPGTFADMLTYLVPYMYSGWVSP